MVTIAVGYDGSASARAAVHEGVSLARGGRLVRAHANDESSPRLTSRSRVLVAQEHDVAEAS